MPPKPEPNIRRLEKSISNFRQYLDRLLKFQNEELNTANLKTCEYHLKFLTNGYNEFIQTQSTYELCELEDEVDHDAVRAEVDEVFFSCGPALETRIENVKAARVAPVQPVEGVLQPQVCPKLPQISLESFDGENVTKWPEFLAQFDGLVHSNPNLNLMSKFQYLRGALSGLAKNVIENLPVTGENYEDARQLLITEFDNPKRICEQHIKALFTYKTLDKACPKRLSELLNHFNSHVRSLTNQQRPTAHWDDLLVYLISSKFDPETRGKWIDHSPTTRLATIADISTFIRTRCHKLGSKADSPQSKSTHTSKPSHSTQKASSNKQSNAHTFHATSKTFTCHLCNATGHTIMRCTTFKNYSIEKRREAIQNLQLCFNCMKPNHSAKSCPIKDLCHVCQRKHHTMLHRDGEQNDNTVSSATSTTSHHPQTFSGSCHITSPSSIVKSQSKYVLLATAVVYVFDKFDTPFKARILLDSGSQINFMTQALATRLGVEINFNATTVSGIGACTVAPSSCSKVQLQSCTSDFATSIECLILPQITDNQPSCLFDKSTFKIPKNIKLADPNFFESSAIDMLIGAAHFFELMSIGQIKMANNLPILQNTRLGWIISGQIVCTKPSTCCLSLLASTTEANVECQVENFWKLDSMPADFCAPTHFDHPCDKHFVSTHQRNEFGCFIVRLPFSESTQSLGDSSAMARRRFIQLEKRLARDSSLSQMYKSFIAEYQNLHHMELVPDNLIKSSNFYLPHHCVLKPDSSTTKLRVVFDASANSSSGKSLNNILMAGPTIQNDLFFVFCRFRSHAFAFSADISKMYRQILMHEDDCNFQYIFWRDDPSQRVHTFKLKTVTYGTSSAPFLATRCLLQLSLENASTFPVASAVLRDDIYVDDVLTGANSIQEAVQIKATVCSILATAGMQLRKWCSNSSAIIDDIAQDDREKVLDMDDGTYVKTLGILWEPDKDIFKFKVQFPPTSRITKRIVLSEVARIFDPIGFLAPIVVLGKLFMQQLWKLKGDWDEPLPMLHHTYWSKFRNELTIN